MAGTLVHAADADVLHAHAELVFRNGKDVYKIKTDGGKPEFTVTDGDRTLSAPLLWAFGTGKVGQSYLFQRDVKYFESRVTYFGTLKIFTSRQRARCLRLTISKRPWRAP
jgi:hypothetical protein